MAGVIYETIVAEDIALGHGTVSRTMPGGGSATGNKVNIATFGDSVGEAYASLPAASAAKGQFRTVNNATSATPGATLAGGGAFYVIAWSNGATWKVVMG